MAELLFVMFARGIQKAETDAKYNDWLTEMRGLDDAIEHPSTWQEPVICPEWLFPGAKVS
jgi:hypothetical protein